MNNELDIVTAACRWHDARAAFLQLAPGSTEAAHRFNDLAEAENRLFAVTSSAVVVADFREKLDAVKVVLEGLKS